MRRALAAALAAALCSLAGGRPPFAARRLAGAPGADALPELTWAKAYGGSGSDEAFDVAVDGDGAVLATGYQTRIAADRGDGGWPGVARPALRGPEDALVWKLHPYGDVAWLATLGGVGGGMGYAVHADVDSGEALACGYTAGLGGAPATFGSGSGAPVLRSRGSHDAYLAKLSAAGTVLWALSVGGTYSDECNAVARDSGTGDALLGGFAGNGARPGDAVRFGPGNAITGRTSGAADAFVARVSPEGEVLWGALFGGSDTDMVLALAADADGAALAAGYFESPTATFGGGPAGVVLRNADGGAGGADAFALKLSALGTLLWAVPLGGPGYDVAWGAAAVPSTGELLVVGSFDGGALTVGTPALGEVVLDASAPDSGSREGYVAKLGPSGEALWAVPVAGAGNKDALRVAVDPVTGAALVAAVAEQADATLGFDTAPAPQSAGLGAAPLPPGEARLVLGALSAYGDPIWSAVVGAGVGFGLAVDPRGGAATAVVTCGVLHDTPAGFAAPVGGAHASLSGHGGQDGFIARFAGPAPPAPPPGAAAPVDANATLAAGTAAGGKSGGAGSLGMAAGGAVGGIAALAAGFFLYRRRRAARAGGAAAAQQRLTPVVVAWDDEDAPAQQQQQQQPPPTRRQMLHSAAAAAAQRSPSPPQRSTVTRLAALQAIASRPPSPRTRRALSPDPLLPVRGGQMAADAPPERWGQQSWQQPYVSQPSQMQMASLQPQQPQRAPSPGQLYRTQPLSQPQQQMRPPSPAQQQPPSQFWQVQQPPPQLQQQQLYRRPPSPGLAPVPRTASEMQQGMARPPSPGSAGLVRTAVPSPGLAPGTHVRTHLRPPSPGPPGLQFREGPPGLAQPRTALRPPSPGLAPPPQFWEAQQQQQQLRRPPSPAGSVVRTQLRPPSPGAPTLQFRDVQGALRPPSPSQFRRLPHPPESLGGFAPVPVSQMRAMLRPVGQGSLGGAPDAAQPGAWRPPSPAAQHPPAAAPAAASEQGQWAEQQQRQPYAQPPASPRTSLRLGAAARSLSLGPQQGAALGGLLGGAAPAAEQQPPVQTFASRRAAMLEQLARADPNVQQPPPQQQPRRPPDGSADDHHRD